MSTVYDQVCKILKTELETNEDPQIFMDRVVVELDNLSTSRWNKLSQELKNWFNSCADIYEKSEEGEKVILPMLEGLEEVTKKSEENKVSEPVEDASTEVVEEVKKTRKTRNSKTKKKNEEVELTKTVEENSTEEVKEAEEDSTEENSTEAVEEVKKPKKTRNPTLKNEGIESKPGSWHIRRIICDNMDISLDDLISELEKIGINMKRAGVQPVHLNTTATLKAILEHGNVKNSNGEVVIIKKS